MLLTNNKTVANSPRARMAEQLASPEGKARCAVSGMAMAAAGRETGGEGESGPARPSSGRVVMHLKHDARAAAQR